MGSVYQTRYIDSHTFMLSNGETPKEKILKDERKKTSHLPQSVRMIDFSLQQWQLEEEGIISSI